MTSTYVPERDGDRLTGWCAVCRHHQRHHVDGACPSGGVMSPQSHEPVAECPRCGAYLDAAESGEYVWRVCWEPQTGIEQMRVRETLVEALVTATWHHDHGHTVLAIERAPVGVWEPVEDEEGEDA